MKTLALEFSTGLRSAAVAEGRRLLGRVAERTPRESGPVALVSGALAAAGCDRSEIGMVAVGLGPGSYHGVRVAIAVAQGWYLGRGVRLVGVPSTDCLAAQAWESGVRGPVGVVVDAQRGEFYLAEFRLEESGWRREGETRLAGLEDVRGRQSDGVRLMGPEPRSALVEVEHWEPDAAAVAVQAAGWASPAEPGALEPIYLREVDYVKAPPARGVPGV